MGVRQKEWAKKAKKKLMVELGGKCVECGTKRKLTFDCVIPTGHAHHKMSFDRRMSYYRAQAADCNLQILCKRHNDEKQDKLPVDPPYVAPLDDNVPF